MKGGAPLVFAAALSLTLSGCSAAEPGPVTFALPYPETSAAGEPILAAFDGRIPCHVAGCEKRKVTVVFYRQAGAQSGTYWLGVVAVALGDERDVRQGAWTSRTGVDGYPNAPVYMLDANAPEDLKSFWRVSDDVLLPLDAQSRPQRGNAAWGYMLSRYAEPYGPRTYR